MGKVVETHLLRAEEFDLLWPKIKEEVLKVSHIWSLHWTLDSIYENVMNEYMQCWGSGWDGATRIFLFTRVCSFPSNRILQTIFMFGNSLHECLPSIIATVESFALGEGCTAIEVVGRRGWKAMLPANGYQEKAAVFTKSLEKGRLQ